MYTIMTTIIIIILLYHLMTFHEMILIVKCISVLCFFHLHHNILHDRHHHWALSRFGSAPSFLNSGCKLAIRTNVWKRRASVRQSKVLLLIYRGSNREPLSASRSLSILRNDDDDDDDYVRAE